MFCNRDKASSSQGSEQDGCFPRLVLQHMGCCRLLLKEEEMQEVITSKTAKAALAAAASAIALVGAMAVAQPAQAVQIDGAKAVDNAGTVRIADKTTVTATESKGLDGTWKWEAVAGASSVKLSNDTSATVTVTGKADGWATLKATFTASDGATDSATAKVKVVGIKSKKTVKGVTYKRTGIDTVTIVKTKKKAIKASSYTINTANLGDKSAFKAEYKVTAIAKRGMARQPKVKSFIVGPNVKTIGNHAFCGAKKMTKLVIGKNVTKIGKNIVHLNCKKLKTLTVKSTKLKNVKNCLKSSKVKTVKVPKAKKAAYKKLFKKAGKKVTVK